MGARIDREHRDEIFVTALVGGATIADAAAKAGMSERTGRRRLEDPEFKRRLTLAQGTHVSQMRRRLEEVSLKAVNTLEWGLDSEKDSDRIRAASTIISLGLKFQDHEERQPPSSAAMSDLSGSESSGGPEDAGVETNPEILAGQVLEGLLDKAVNAVQSEGMSDPSFSEAVRFFSLYTDLRGVPKPDLQRNYSLQMSRLLEFIEEELPLETQQALADRLWNDREYVEISRQIQDLRKEARTAEIRAGRTRVR